MNRWLPCLAGLVLTFSTVGCCYHGGYYDPVTGCAPGGYQGCLTCPGPYSSCGPVCDTGYCGSGGYGGYPCGSGCLLVDCLHSLHSALFCGWAPCYGGYGWGPGWAGCGPGGCYDGCGFAPGCGTPCNGCSTGQPGGFPGPIQQPLIAPPNGLPNLGVPTPQAPVDPSSLYQGPTVPPASYNSDPLELRVPIGDSLHDARNRRWIPARL